MIGGVNFYMRPDSVFERREEGLSLLQRGMYDQAYQSFDRLVALDESDKSAIALRLKADLLAKRAAILRNWVRSEAE
jgi:hypothetical protein